MNLHWMIIEEFPEETIPELNEQEWTGTTTCGHIFLSVLHKLQTQHDPK